MRIAVVGSGISGLSCAWLLSQRHQVELFEADARIGGHSHTVDATCGLVEVPVDTGFIVYNEPAYPNLTALFKHLDVPTRASDMSFAVSLDGGQLEYAGTDLNGLFAQRANLVKPRFWRMLRELTRFYREAARDAAQCGDMPLDDYLDSKGYGRAFRDDHLYPMGAAIWSATATDIGRYPMAAFVRFCENHGLLKLSGRPIWRTVDGGSREYVIRLTVPLLGHIHRDDAVVAMAREKDGVTLRTRRGAWTDRFDHVVLATHADQALRLLPTPTADEQRLLGAFGYTRNLAVLHRDPSFMPRRRAVWSSWNYLADRTAPTAAAPTVTYWMNRLQGHLPQGRTAPPLFVTLNPPETPAKAHLISAEVYEHPRFDAAAIQAQRELWKLQGGQRTWFCGAYFGSGFHEDGLQAGLAVAEALGDVRRPWSVPGESSRIHLPQAVAA